MKQSFKALHASLLAIPMCAAGHASTWGADAVTPEDLLRALQSTETRAPNFKSDDPCDGAMKELQSISETRSFSLKERSQVADCTRANPQKDLYVPFDFGSDAINSEAYAALNALGAALAHDAVKEQSFVVAGHTDAKGTAEYNQGLSERRARAVRDYLVRKFSIDAKRLLPVGFGFEQLRDPNQPYADVNRRVQVVNQQK